MNTLQSHTSAANPPHIGAVTTALASVAFTLFIGFTTAAHATPAKDFVSDVTEAHFDPLRIIYGDDDDRDSFRSHRFEIDPKIRFVVRDPSDYYIVTNTVAAGGYSGWHTHPGPSVVLVKSGVATVYDGDDPSCTPKTYAAGSGFVDPGDGHIHMVRNEGAAVLITQAFQIIPTGAARRIDAVSPGNCPF